MFARYNYLPIRGFEPRVLPASFALRFQLFFTVLETTLELGLILGRESILLCL